MSVEDQGVARVIEKCSIPIAKWEEALSEFRNLMSNNVEWVFRGQGDSLWHLESSLERATDHHASKRNDAARIENELINNFKRGIHQYIPSTELPDNELEWLSVMQHHGAPTRLLDFTFSAYIAAYFAFEDCPRNEKETKRCVVWAIRRKWLCDKARGKIAGLVRSEGKDPDDIFNRPVILWRSSSLFSSAFLNNGYQMVCPVNSYRVNRRQGLQQGLYLCPGDIRVGFLANLLASGVHEIAENLKIFTFPVSLQEEALGDLARMNIRLDVLFPGIDGFAQYHRVWTRYI
ncbi:MAG: FRG domain-containing protein [Candidatus Hydrogenedentes bacterium]|nr:FRG domain-containing protein [Candidatus Hydrogenedentota bacterium]